jgi:asparagine synthase (glutamine-hydrolysing)
MRTLLAGRYSPRGEGSTWPRGEELARRSGAEFASSGALSLVRERGGDAGTVACAWTGRISGLGRLAEAAGIAPTARAEEILAAGYRRLGTAMLHRLRGAFLLLVWDREAERGLIGTDLLGQCALFWRETGDGAVFASELGHLLPVLDSRPPPDDLSVIHMLTRPGPPRGRTPYAGVRRLETGSCVELDGRGWRVTRHWQPRYEGSLRGSREELAAALRDEIGAAVGRSLEGGGRAGVFLSGGIDSSITTAVASGLGADLRAYSAVFPDHPELDESDYIDSVVEESSIGSRRFAIDARGSLAASLEYLGAWEVPILGIGFVLERALGAEAAADGVELVLDGQGGDEVFGTTPYVAAHDLARGRLLRSIRTTQSTPWTSAIPTARARLALWRSAAFNPWIPDRIFTAVRRMRGRQPPAPDLLTEPGQRAYLESVDDGAWKHASRGPLWWRYMSDLMIYNASGDRCDYLRHRSALFGMEARSPLLDVDLALFALRLPPHLAMDPERDRPLARDAMEGVLPEKVRTRTGKSNLSQFYWEVVTRGDMDDVRRLLSDPGCEVYRYVDRERVLQALEHPPEEFRLATQPIVEGLQACAVVECWLQRQEDPESTSRLLEQFQPAAYREPASALRTAC